MEKNRFVIGSISILAVAAAALYILRPTEEASTPFEVVPANICQSTEGTEPDVKK